MGVNTDPVPFVPCPDEVPPCVDTVSVDVERQCTAGVVEERSRTVTVGCLTGVVTFGPWSAWAATDRACVLCETCL